MNQPFEDPPTQYPVPSTQYPVPSTPFLSTSILHRGVNPPPCRIL